MPSHCQGDTLADPREFAIRFRVTSRTIRADGRRSTASDPVSPMSALAVIQRKDRGRTWLESQPRLLTGRPPRKASSRPGGGSWTAQRLLDVLSWPQPRGPYPSAHYAPAGARITMPSSARKPLVLALLALTGAGVVLLWPLVQRSLSSRFGPPEWPPIISVAAAQQRVPFTLWAPGGIPSGGRFLGARVM